MESKLTLKQVNELSYKQFHSLFENVIESWPEGAVFVSALAPFPKVTDLIKAFDNYLERLNADTKVKIFKLHPMTEFLGEDSLTNGESAKIKKLSDDYKAKFGYPFIICNQIEILQSLGKRINNSAETEMNNQINEVKKICKLRILEIVENL